MILDLVDAKHAFFNGNTFSYKALIKVVPGAAWNSSDRRWEVPIESVMDAKRILPSLQLSEDIQRLVKALDVRNKKAIELKSADESKAVATVKGLKGTLRPYQAVGKAFLDVLQQGEGAILGYDMGLGKSLTGLATFLDWKNRGIVDYCLVICPAPLKYSTWEKEVQKWTDLEVVIVDGDKPEVVEWDDGTKEKLKGRSLREVQYLQYQYGAAIIVMNYELFLHDSEVDRWDKVRDLNQDEIDMYFRLASENNDANGRKADSAKGLAVASKALVKMLVSSAEAKEHKIYGKKTPCLAKRRVLHNIIPRINDRWCVILDEAHRCKNNKSSAVKRIFKALPNAGRKIPMSGTPLENNIQELWSLVDLCRPGLLGTHFKFIDRYCEKDFFGTIVGPKVGMMQELKDRIAPIMLRKTKEEALPDLPELTVQDYWVTMTPEQTKLYAMIKEGILQNLETQEFSYLETLAQLTRLQQLLDSPRLLKEVLGDDTLPIESGKLNELAHLIEDIGPKKFVLFSQYREMTDILYNWLIDSKILQKDQIGYIHGGMQARKTAQIQDGFQEGDIQCVLMTTAGNYGLQLDAGSYVICYDELWNPQKMAQIYSRVHRSGVKNAVIAINMVTRGTYEEHKLKILEGKKELFSAMIDNDDTAFASILSKDDFINMI